MASKYHPYYWKGGPKPRSVTERFWDKVQKGDCCWVWIGWRDRNGYGKIRDRTGGKFRDLFAHRVSWEVLYGPIPDGLCVLHRCDNPCCVNPKHLFLGTSADNVHDMISKGRFVVPPRQGSRNGRARLTENQIVQIRDLIEQGVPRKQIAEMFGVSVSAINHIARRRRWAVVQGG